MKKTILFTTASLALLFASCKKEASVNPSNINEVSSAINEENGSIIEGKYIVVLKESAELNVKTASASAYSQKLTIVSEYGKSLLKEKNITSAFTQVYGKTIKGFALSLNKNELQILSADSRVDFIEPDRVITLGKPSGGGGGGSQSQETPWGITRVGNANGTGKTAWIIDSGVDLTHPDLNVDVARSRTFVTTGADASSPNDRNGHGSHVAGTIAAKNNTIGVVGVAYNATVVAVKVLNSQGSGSYSQVIAGVDYVAANAAAGDVANMSLGGPVSEALDNAVLNASNIGIYFALAAGNESTNSNNSSPARINGQYIFTVSAMGTGDNWASFSNYANPPVDFCEPGVNIKSTWKSGGYNTISGTSMATPHLAGILLITNGNPVINGYVNNDPDGTADAIGHL